MAKRIESLDAWYHSPTGERFLLGRLGLSGDGRVALGIANADLLRELSPFIMDLQGNRYGGPFSSGDPEVRPNRDWRPLTRSHPLGFATIPHGITGCELRQFRQSGHPHHGRSVRCRTGFSPIGFQRDHRQHGRSPQATWISVRPQAVVSGSGLRSDPQRAENGALHVNPRIGESRPKTFPRIREGIRCPGRCRNSGGDRRRGAGDSGFIA